MQRAAAVAHQGTLWRRLRETLKARRGQIDVPIVWGVRDAQARAFLEQISKEVARAPVDARLDLAAKTKVRDQPGRALDVEATIRALAGGRHEEEETIDLVTHQVAPRITWNELTRVEVDRVVSAFATTFSLVGTGAGRAVNIKNAASKIDGVILRKGTFCPSTSRWAPEPPRMASRWRRRSRATSFGRASAEGHASSRARFTPPRSSVPSGFSSGRRIPGRRAT
jgi:hypothetical protein